MAKVCVVGSDGRADVLRDVLGRHADVVVSKGRPGIPNSTDTDPLKIDADLFVISPEQPLVDGLADALRAQGKLVFGPGADGAKLEGSKKWMKEVLDAAGVPTAAWVSGTLKDLKETETFGDFVKKYGGKVAVKTDGLAAGKGVLVCSSESQANTDILEKLTGESFGEAGRTVVVEELLCNPEDLSDPRYYELSVFVATNGKGESAIFQLAQDFKRLRDGDEGPNTGGMGSYSPVPSVSDEMLQDIYQTCIQPVEQELIKRDIDYRGFLFCGIMMTPEGPKVLEYNVRFGDPEAQSVLPRVSSNLVELLMACAKGEKPTELTFSDDAVVTVVLAAKGYAEEDVQGGDVITGIDEAKAMDGVSVYCAGTAQDDDGELITAGGRIVAVTGRGKDVKSARQLAYEGAGVIDWDGKQYRSDIAKAA